MFQEYDGILKVISLSSGFYIHLSAKNVTTHPTSKCKYTNNVVTIYIYIAYIHTLHYNIYAKIRILNFETKRFFFYLRSSVLFLFLFFLANKLFGPIPVTWLKNHLSGHIPYKVMSRDIKS